MNKLKFIIIVGIMILLFSFVIFMNFGKIETYINEKQWEMITPIATIHLDKYVQSAGCGDKILIIENDQINAYSSTNISEYKQPINVKDIVTDSDRDYCVMGEKDGSKLFLFNEKGKLWESEINGEILAVSVNKNGYVACIYAKSGYKSLIKVINPSGEELFTNYLVSTYALDVDISNDNKYLAIAEVNTEGITLESDIKIVDINNASDSGYVTIQLDSNMLLLDVEYTDKNELLILEDGKIEKINSNYERNTIKEYNASIVSHASIENGNHAVIVEKSDTGIFSTDYILKVNDGAQEWKEFTLESSVKSICVQGKTIVVDIGGELIFLNTSGKMLKRCRVDGQVREMKLYNNGAMAGIVFKDRIEIVKL